MSAAAGAFATGTSALADADPPPARVLIVDDHRIFASAIELALAGEGDLTCVGKAHTIESGLNMARALQPDLVVMDVRLGDGDGLAATAELTRELPDLRVVVLTAFADPVVTRRAQEAGACAVLPKAGDLDDLLDALRTTLNGGIVAPAPAYKPRARQVGPLTGRQELLLRMLVTGLDTAVMAREIGVSTHECLAEIAALLLLLGAKSEFDALVIAMRHGLIHAATAD